MSPSVKAFKRNRARLRLAEEPDAPRYDGPTDRVALAALFAPGARVTRGGSSARDALRVYSDSIGKGASMPLYLIDPGYIASTFESRRAMGNRGIVRVDASAWGVPVEEFPQPPSSECFIAWGEPVTVEVTDPVATFGLLAAHPGVPPELLRRHAEMRVKFHVSGIYIFDAETEHEDWAASVYVREEWEGPGHPQDFTYPLELVISDGERLYVPFLGAGLLLDSALRACATHGRAEQTIPKKRAKHMRRQGRALPSQFYIVSQQPLRQHAPHQGGTHASPSFQHDVRGHWAHRVKRIVGELDDKGRSRWTRKNTERRSYRFIAYPATPEQQQFLRDIGRTPPGKGQYLRVTRYWVPGHTRGPEDAPHVHAIKVMEPDQQDSGRTDAA